MQKNQPLKKILEALLFTMAEPVSVKTLAKAFEDPPPPGEIEAALLELKKDYLLEGRAFELVEVANGFQFRSRPEYAPWIKKLVSLRAPRLSRSAMETLSVIAYKQPITRVEIEQIRGVDSSSVLKTLLDRRMIRILGRKDAPGHPLVYGTSKQFLEVFGLKNLSHLPPIEETEENESEEKETSPPEMADPLDPPVTT
ncbi:MAG: SMC-Scp complex subunit ScpB [Deltaproteobacteria bacterium]|nr:MAG: SMC-Scp complex subunit ScpB [Deltaproteobacteria bacterium]